MADFRLSAKVISRSNGQSSVASAAYRAAARLIDIRTGEVHDYTRKGGVVSSEILAPDDAPEWAHDRTMLWGQVEQAEKRRDAQLARELQLSLPHELDQQQRQALVLDFVREQCVNHGMIADVSIHAPPRDGDDRNHHAHVMLTMRSLSADGFGQKVRDWNSPDLLQTWREAWAHHQNRAFERYGHAVRVDHRSYKDQGVDREPTQHMGPTATDMERSGKQSRIGDENRDRDGRNSDRAADHAAAGVLDLAIEKERRQMQQRHALERDELQAALDTRNKTRKQTITRELEAIQERMLSKGWRGLLRTVTGRNREDRKRAEDLAHVLQQILLREQAQRSTLADRQHDESAALQSRSDQSLADRYREAGKDGHGQALRPSWEKVADDGRNPWEADLTRGKPRTRGPGEDGPD